MTANTHKLIKHYRGTDGHWMHRAPLTLMAVLFSWVVLHGQVRQTPGVGGGLAASDFPPSPEVAPTFLSILDSLDFALIDIDIRKAQTRVAQNSFWLRIIPSIRIARSYPLTQLIPEEVPYSATYYTYRPYSISFSFSLKDILDNSSHEQAQLDVKRLEAKRAQLRLQKQRSRLILQQQLRELRDLVRSLRSEIDIISNLVAFNQLRFDQGNLEYDQLMRTRLELLKARRSLRDTEHEIAIKQSGLHTLQPSSEN